MGNDMRTVTYTADDLALMRARGEDLTDWKRVEAMSDADVEAAIAADPDEAGMIVDWDNAAAGSGRSAITAVPLDADVLAYFQGLGRGYQAAINAVLRSYIQQTRR